MLKYVDAKVVMAEVPNEITLAINISSCPCNCKGCHSNYLAQDIGEPLTTEQLEALLNRNQGITAVCFMGGDSDPSYINECAEFVRQHTPEPLRIAWYSGRQELSNAIELKNFDYIKLGPYIEEYGPLNSRTTNQRFYTVIKDTESTNNYTLQDNTSKFWKGN